FLVKTQASATVAAQMREAMWQIDPRQAATREFALRDDLDSQMKPARFFANAIGGFAVCALLLAALGVYAVAAQNQQQRRSEFGLRLAIGAPPWRLARQSVARSLRGAAMGVGIGAVAGTALVRVLESQVGQVGDATLAWQFAAAGVIALAAILASLPPALGAARTDPMIA